MGICAVVIGLGQIGARYDLSLDPSVHVYSHARAFQVHPEFNLVAGIDTKSVNREDFTSHYALPTYQSYEEAIVDLVPDLVTVAVPTEAHLATVEHVLATSPPKAILCEKPLALNWDDAHRIVRMCRDHNVELYVNYFRRSEPGALSVYRLIRQGEIGVPLKGVVWYSKGFLHNGSHLFNLLELWLGEYITGHGCGGYVRTTQGDVEGSFQARFQLGTVVFLAANEEHYSHLSIELVAPNGRLRYENGGRHIEWQGVTESYDLPGYRFLDSAVEHIVCDMNRYQWHVADNIYRCMNQKSGAVCTGDQALRTLGNVMNLLGGYNVQR